MTIDNLQRVIWRLREQSTKGINPTNLELERAIMIEIGTDKRTYNNTRRALLKLGWIKAYKSKRVKLTDKDLTDM